MGRKKTKAEIVSTACYTIDELEDIVAYEEASRLIIRPERITGNLNDGKVLKQVLWQMVTCAHSTWSVMSSGDQKTENGWRL